MKIDWRYATEIAAASRGATCENTDGVPAADYDHCLDDDVFRADVSALTRAQRRDIALSQIHARSRRDLLLAGVKVGSCNIVCCDRYCGDLDLHGRPA